MTVRTQSQGQWLYIICTWLLCGTLDLVAAVVINPSVPFTKIGRYIASGVFGERAATDANMGFFGIMFHYLIALSFVVIFFKLYPLLQRLLIYQLLIALMIGLSIWCLMNLIVVPLSNTPKFPLTLAAALKNMLALVIAFGIPIPFVAERYYRKD